VKGRETGLLAEGYAPGALLPAIRGSARAMLFLRQIEILLGRPAGLRCMDVGGEGGWISAMLRQGGGEWTSADEPGPALESLRHMVGDERVVALGDGRIPVDDQSFDVVVLVDILEHVADEAAFIHECHRILKPAGKLIVNVPFSARVAPLRLVRGLAGLGDDRVGHVRRGYTRRELFDVLKDGFDVQDIRRYSRLLIEAAEVMARRSALNAADAAASHRPDPITINRAQAQAWKRLAWVSWTAAQLDALLFLSPGYRMIVRAKRRLWIPRKAPVLRDGRSIAEATLGARIGSASALSAAKGGTK